MHIKTINSCLTLCERSKKRVPPCLHQSSTKLRSSTHSSTSSSARMQPNVVLVGGSYAGMAAVSALLALKDGQPIPMAPYADFSHLSAAPRIADLRITIIDERDGFCMFCSTFPHDRPSLLTLFLLYSLHSRQSSCILLPRAFGGYVAPVPRLSHAQSTRRKFCARHGCASQASQPDIGLSNPQGRQQSISYDYLLASTGMRRSWRSSQSRPKCVLTWMTPGTLHGVWSRPKSLAS